MFQARSKMARGLLTVLMLSFALIVSGCATTGQSGPLPDGSVLVKGKVKKISQTGKMLTIKPSKGDPVTVTFGAKTELKGFPSSELIAKNQPVEVIYRAEESGNIALFIKQLPEGACQ